jgi:hypothetical protein
MSYYNPNPTKVWYRVQNQCSVNTLDNSNNNVYVPLNNQYIPMDLATLQDKIQYKGNILQYKNNSSRLTKSQKYAQISKGLWCNRKKAYATQSETYTNPNTTGLLRVNSVEIPFPNDLVGYPNNISGPYQYNVTNPYECPSNSFQSGGNLICSSYANPCTGEITKNVYEKKCYPNYCSDVPGQPIELCWNPKLTTYFPRQRYVMNNSLSKWPQGYKSFVSATKPAPPVLQLETKTNTEIVLTWSYTSSQCIPISSFNIYQNGSLINNVPYTTNKTKININNKNSYNFYVTSLSTNIESSPSNSITA